MNNSSIQPKIPAGAVALPGLGKPVKADAKKNKVETVAIKEFPAKATTTETSFEKLSDYKTLKILSSTKKGDTIYYSTKKNEFAVAKKRNWFVRTLKSLVLFNVFKYSFRSFSKNENKVQNGFNRIIKDLPTLLKQAKTDGDKQKLISTLTKIHTNVLEPMREQHKKNGESLKADGIELLQNKIEDFIQSNTSIINIKKSPKAVVPPPSVGNVQPPPSMDVIPPLPHSGSPINLAGGKGLNLGSVKLSPASQQDKEPVKPILPELATYKLPEVQVQPDPIGLISIESKQLDRHQTLLTRLTDYYADFIEARNEFIRVSKDLDDASVDLKPQNIPNQANTNGIPPLPSKGMPPPPPEDAPLLVKQKSWKEKQEELKNVKKLDIVDLVLQKNKSEGEMNSALNIVKDILFPGVKGISFSTDEEVETLDKYVESYKAQAETTIAELKVLAGNNLKPASKGKNSSGSNGVNAQPKVQEPKEVKTLRTLLRVIANSKKAISTKEKQVDSYTKNKGQITDQLNKLAKKIALSSMSSSYANKAKDAEELATLQANLVSKEKDIATAQEGILIEQEKIASNCKTLEAELKVKSKNLTNDELVEAAEAKITELLEKTNS